MRTLSTGQPSTLANYKVLCTTFFGENSAATKFIQQKIDKEGEDAEVMADEHQMVYLLTQYHLQPDNIVKTPNY